MQTNLDFTVTVPLTIERLDAYNITDGEIGDLIEIDVDIEAYLISKGCPSFYNMPSEPPEYDIIEISEKYKNKLIKLDLSEVLEHNDLENEIIEKLLDVFDDDSELYSGEY